MMDREYLRTLLIIAYSIVGVGLGFAVFYIYGLTDTYLDLIAVAFFGWSFFVDLFVLWALFNYPKSVGDLRRITSQVSRRSDGE